MDCETDESDDENSDAANLDEGLVLLLRRLLCNDQDAPAFRHEGAEASTHMATWNNSPFLKLTGEFISLRILSLTQNLFRA